jgi:hypothetical protein
MYKLVHGQDGYIILIYKTPKNELVFPVLPNGSYILVDLMTYRLNTIKEYAASEPFKKFVANRNILERIEDALTYDGGKITAPSIDDQTYIPKTEEYRVL